MRWLLLAALVGGCAGPVVSKVKVTPPVAVAAPEEPSPAAPEPAPAERGDAGDTSAAADDPDGDGIVGEADRCPDAPETVNQHEDDDGCPDEAPRR